MPKKGNFDLLEKASVNHLKHLINHVKSITVKYIHIHLVIPPRTPLRKFAIKLISCLITIHFMD